MKKEISLLFIFIIIIIFTAGCKTLKSKYVTYNKETIKLKVKSGKSVFIIKENDKKEMSAILKSDYLLGSEITGEIKKTENDQSGGMIFNIKKIKFRASSGKGYNIGECSAAGSIIFKNDGNILKSSSPGSIEILEVINGDIRCNDYYYRGGEGKKKIQERLDRISETVKFLKIRKLKKIYGKLRFDKESFKNETAVILFPEIFGFRNLKRKNLLDKDFDLSDLNVPDDMILIDEIIWRKSYTKKIFPEILHSIRNSGSMYKDYEEALDIFFILYNLDYFSNDIINNSEWNKTK